MAGRWWTWAPDWEPFCTRSVTSGPRTYFCEGSCHSRRTELVLQVLQRNQSPSSDCTGPCVCACVCLQGHVFSSCSQLIGLELSQQFVTLQNDMVQKYKLADRVKVHTHNHTQCTYTACPPGDAVSRVSLSRSSIPTFSNRTFCCRMQMSSS